MILFWIGSVLFLLFAFVVFFGAPYVPSKKGEAKRALDELYRLGSEDVLIDIGSGDGVILRIAAERGARAVGYEINPILVLISRWMSRSMPNVEVRFKNFWHETFPRDTTVVYVFGDSRDIGNMVKKIQDSATELGRPLWLISYAIEAPHLEPKKKLGAHFLYEIEPLQITAA